MESYTHNCIKPGCSTRYTDNDPDAYYCEPCNAERKELAKKIDAQVALIPQRPRMSALQEYDASPKVHGFVRVKL